MSYCCDTDETGRGCNSTDFCSDDLLTTSMKMVACPFVTKQCTGTSSQLALKNYQTQTLQMSYSKNRYFNETAICYYQIYADPKVYNLTTKQYYINIQIASYYNVYVHLNNGSSVKTAEDAIFITSSTETNYTYEAYNNSIFLIIVGYDEEPSVKITYKLFRVIPTVTNTTNTTTNSTVVTPPNNVTDSNTTTNSTTNVTIATYKPQYAIYLIQALVVVGIFTFVIVDTFIVTKNNDESEFLEFNDNPLKNTFRDEFSSNRKFLQTINIDDVDDKYQHSEPDVFYRDSNLQSKHKKNDSYDDKSQIQDKSSNPMNFESPLKKQFDLQRFAKVTPIDESKLNNSTIVHDTKDPPKKDKNFWSKFKLSKTDKDKIRRFSMLNQNQMMMPKSVNSKTDKPQDTNTSLRNSTVATIPMKESITNSDNFFGSMNDMNGNNN